MPKDTFFNLPEEKRNEIVRLAAEEFARYDYKSASITRIVQNAGIAKGSMYQYFENKRDLFIFLIENAADKKLKYISENADLGGKGFFEVYKEIILVGARFDYSEITSSLMIMNMNIASVMEEFPSLAASLRDKSANFLSDFIKNAQDSGELRQDMPLELMIFAVNALSVNFGEYLERKYKFSVIDALGKGPGWHMPFTLNELEAEVDGVIEVLKHGLSAATREMY